MSPAGTYFPSMLWSSLKQWPRELPLPDAVTSALRKEGFHEALDRDLEGWIFEDRLTLLKLGEFIGPLDRKHWDSYRNYQDRMREAAAILAWRRQGTDGPFR